MSPGLNVGGVTPGRSVLLRHEQQGGDLRTLRAYLNNEGDLVLEGHDLGPSTAPASADGEYEYSKTVRAVDVPGLQVLLGAETDADILDVLARDWTGAASYELEAKLSESVIPVKLFVWSG